MRHVLVAFSHGLVALAFVLPVISEAGCVRRVVSIEEVDKMINEQLLIGSNKRKAKDFIDNLKVDSLKINRGDFYKPTMKPVGFWDPEKIDKLWDRTTEFISARVIDAQSGFLNRNDIFIEFAIDKDERVIGYTIKMLGAE